MKKKRPLGILIIASIIISTHSFYLILHVTKNPLIYRSLVVNAISPLSALFPLGNYILPLLAIFFGYQIFLLRNAWRVAFIVYQVGVWVVSIGMSLFGSTFSCGQGEFFRFFFTGIVPICIIFSLLPAIYIYFLTRSKVKVRFR